MNTAPFTITHHDEGLSWDDSSVLKGLVNASVVVTTREGYIFDGEIIAVEDGTIKMTNDVVGNAWTEMTLTLTSITNIHYC